MENYINLLMEMGISHTRAVILAEAMNTLNAAIGDLDNSGLRSFGSKFGIIGHLDQFAQSTGDRNVARELYMIGLKRAFKNIDPVEFDDFSDKLFYLTEQAAELDIPGSKMLCKSLIDLRNVTATRKRLFARLAAKMNNIGFVNGPCGGETLTIDEGIYNSHNRHLNDNKVVGHATYLHTYESRRNKDHGESGTRYVFIKVDHWDYETNRKELAKAIKATYKSDSCGHDWCGCGCTRTSVPHVKFLAEIQCSDVYVVKIHWSKNV